MIEKVREKVPLNVSLRTFPLSLSKYIYIYMWKKRSNIFAITFCNKIEIMRNDYSEYSFRKSINLISKY